MIPWYCGWKKSQKTIWRCIPNPVNHGVNYQPQLVSFPDFWLAINSILVIPPPERATRYPNQIRLGQVRPPKSWPPHHVKEAKQDLETPFLWLVTVDKMDVSHNQCWRNSIRRWWSKIAVLSSLVLEKHCKHFVLGRVAVNLNMYLGKGLGGFQPFLFKNSRFVRLHLPFLQLLHSQQHQPPTQLGPSGDVGLAIISEDDLGSHLHRLGSTSYPLTKRIGDRMDSGIGDRIDLELHCLHRFRVREDTESGRNGHGMFKWCWRGWIAW